MFVHFHPQGAVLILDVCHANWLSYVEYQIQVSSLFTKKKKKKKKS